MDGPDFTGRVVLVTGGTRGLGLAMLSAFARAGADVVVSSRRREACEQVATALKEKTGRAPFVFPAHVGDWAAAGELVEATYQRFGHLDVLVNNAGMSPTYGSLADVSEVLFDKVIGVNLRGPFRLCALAGPRMAADRGGAIINISSTAAVRPTPAALPYAAAKAGLHALTAGFAQDLGPSVRVNAIMAGPFATDVSAGWDWEAFNAEAQRYPLRRAGRPAEVVGAALYLASDAASFTTGSVLAVDGGRAVTP